MVIFEPLCFIFSKDVPHEKMTNTVNVGYEYATQTYTSVSTFAQCCKASATDNMASASIPHSCKLQRNIVEKLLNILQWRTFYTKERNYM